MTLKELGIRLDWQDEKLRRIEQALYGDGDKEKGILNRLRAVEEFVTFEKKIWVFFSSILSILAAAIILQVIKFSR